MRIICDNAYHDRGEGVCSFCVQKRIDDAVNVERERCIKIVQDRWNWGEVEIAKMIRASTEGGGTK